MRAAHPYLIFLGVSPSPGYMADFTTVLLTSIVNLINPFTDWSTSYNNITISPSSRYIYTGYIMILHVSFIVCGDLELNGNSKRNFKCVMHNMAKGDNIVTLRLVSI